MSLEWVREHRGQLARTGVLRQVLRAELIEQALAEAGIALQQRRRLRRCCNSFGSSSSSPRPSGRPGWPNGS